MLRRTTLRLDHVHLLVSDRERAADWCARSLGFEELERSKDPYGPLVVSGDGGDTGLALFTSRVSAEPNRVVAFRVDGEELLAFAARLLQVELRAPSGSRLRPEDAVDHGDVLSYYFSDPDGNAFELLTRDSDRARRGLARLSADSRIEL